MDRIADDSVPLCFDTNAAWGGQQISLLRRLRARHTGRRFLLPAWTVAERVRHLHNEYQEKFDLDLVESFLADTELHFEIVGFDRHTAVHPWLAVTADPMFRYGWEPRDGQCGLRCRAADFINYAVARQHQALLVTDDKRLRGEVERDGYTPGAVASRQLAEFVASR